MAEYTALGILNKVELRNVWTNESQHFTPWLAQPENLRLLAEAIGLDELELISTEKGVGPFSADILCKNTLDDSFVLIENQLERTDHKHLGQLLTYAAGLEAVTIVWIAERITEEHRAALDWLNQITPEKYSFFGLEIELWKIGESVPAPKFNIVSKPNDWSKSTVTAATGGELSETNKVQLEFWTAFYDFMGKQSTITCQKPRPQQWMHHPIGKSGVHLSSVISTWSADTNEWEPEIRVQLVLNSVDAKVHFGQLLKTKVEIEQQIGNPLVWYQQEDTKKCRIYIKKKIDFSQEKNRSECYTWMKTYLEKFYNAFSPAVRQF